MRAALLVVLVAGCSATDNFGAFQVGDAGAGDLSQSDAGPTADAGRASDQAQVADLAPTPPLLVDVSGYYNQLGVYTDGATFAADGGLSGTGDACSANVLADAPPWFGCTIPATGSLDGNTVQARGQTIVTKQGHFSTLRVLALAVYGPRVVHFGAEYVDGGNVVQVALKPIVMSDWLTPEQNNAPESVVVALPYYLRYDGRTDSRKSYIYGYEIPLDPARTLASVVLPDDPDVTVFAASLEQ